MPCKKEFFGTMILVFAGSTAAIMEDQSGGAVTLVGLAMCGGLVVMLLIPTTAHISGAHLNPSITIAFAFLRHFPWRQVLTHHQDRPFREVFLDRVGESKILSFVSLSVPPDPKTTVGSHRSAVF